MTNNAQPDRVWIKMWDDDTISAHKTETEAWIGSIKYTPAAAHDALQAKYDALEQTALKHAEERSRTIAALQTGQAAIAAKLAQVEAERDSARKTALFVADLSERSMAERDAARAENAALREALQPFADAAGDYDEPNEHDGRPWLDIEDANLSGFTIGHLRRASAALQSKDNADE